jgi:hypothetical protein
MEELPKKVKLGFAWAAGVILVLSALFAGVDVLIRAETAVQKSQIEGLVHDVAALKDEVKVNRDNINNTNETVKGLLSKAFDKEFSIQTKPTKNTLEKAEQIIQFAQASNIKIEPVALAKYGAAVARFSEDPALGEIAWRSLKQAVDYRSYLNKDYVPLPKDLTEWPNREGKYHTSVVIVGEIPDSKSKVALSIRFAGGIVGERDSARIELLAHPQPMGSEIGLYILDGGSTMLGLDGMYLKNVIVRNAQLVYNGGPIRLENVAFVNCTFVLAKNKPTINLGDAILQANSINFSTVAPS